MILFSRGDFHHVNFLWFDMSLTFQSQEKLFTLHFFPIKLSLVNMNNLIKYFSSSTNLWWKVFLFKKSRDNLKNQKSFSEFSKFFQQLQTRKFLLFSYRIFFILFLSPIHRKWKRQKNMFYDKLGITIRHQKFNQKILKTHVNAKLQK